MVDRDLSSALRGVWGRALRSIYCYQKELDCAACDFATCTYHVLFEKKFSSSEHYHPYIIQSRFNAPGEIMVWFKFFGWICEHIDKLVYSIVRMHSKAIFLQGEHLTLALKEIHDENKLIYSSETSTVKRPHLRKLLFSPQECPELQITFKTPLRQKFQGSLMSDFKWEPFAKSLIKRIRYIDEHFNRSELMIPENIEIGYDELGVDLHWSEKVRVSFRQDARMSIGGLIGTINIKGLSREMVAILKLARFLHAGKQCTFGNGELGIKKMSVP